MALKRFKRRTILGAITIVIVVAGLAQIAVGFLFPSAPPTSGKILQSTSTSGGFSISHPEHWAFRETPRGYQGDSTVVAFLVYPNLPKLGIYIVIRRQNISYGSVEAVAEMGEQTARKQQGYRELSMERSTAGNEETLLREYVWLTPATPLQSSQPRQCLDNYRLHNRTAYILTLCVDAENFSAVKPTFQQMIESFTYLD